MCDRLAKVAVAIAVALGGTAARAQPLGEATQASVVDRSRSDDAAKETVELTLAVGEQRVLSAENVRSYSEGTRGVVDVRLTRDTERFVLVGEKPGETTLLFLMRDGTQRHYTISVVDPDKPESSDPGRVQAVDNVRLDFYFVQLNKSYSHQIGIGWPAAAGGGTVSASFDLLAGQLQSATAVVADQALPRLDMAQAAGFAKVLKQAAVITANGSEASFSGGGEVNIPIQGSLVAEIRAIEFGSLVQVLPRYDRETGRIELSIHAEVADLVDDNGTGAPGRLTSKLQTVVNLELGQSLVVAGLTSRRELRNQAGLPGLSQIPILGGLFGSNRRQNQESENVVFIVPTVVDAVSVEARERVREALEVYETYTGDLDEVDFLHAPPAKGGSS